MPNYADYQRYMNESTVNKPWNRNPNNPTFSATGDEATSAGLDQVFDPGKMVESTLDPTGYAYRNRPPEQQFLAQYGIQGLADLKPAGSFDDYHAQTKQLANQQYGVRAQEQKETGARQSGNIAKAYANRGISGGMSLAPQMQVSEQTQRGLNQLRAEMDQQAFQQAAGRQEMDRQNQARLSEIYSRQAQGGYQTPNNATADSKSGILGRIFGGIF